MITPHIKGQTAASNGRSRGSSPYDPFTQEFRDWHRGYEFQIDNDEQSERDEPWQNAKDMVNDCQFTDDQVKAIHEIIDALRIAVKGPHA